MMETEDSRETLEKLRIFVGCRSQIIAYNLYLPAAQGGDRAAQIVLWSFVRNPING